jgi:hypothetical protein
MIYQSYPGIDSLEDFIDWVVPKSENHTHITVPQTLRGFFCEYCDSIKKNRPSQTQGEAMNVRSVTDHSYNTEPSN